MDDTERCPSCDSPGEWEVSRRHRFSPFGSVLLAVAAFWSAIVGWLAGWGLVIAFVLLFAAVFMNLVTRRAEVCSSCGFVRRLRR